MKSQLSKTSAVAVSITGRISCFILLNLMLLLSGLGTLSIVQAQEPVGCIIEEANQEIRYEEATVKIIVDEKEDKKKEVKVFLVCVDLTNPYIRFETVMAQGETDVNPHLKYGQANLKVRERVEEMVARPEYAPYNPIVVFNADYFGDGPNVHGPEGPTIKKGTRLDGPYSTNDLRNDKSLRVALSVSRLNEIDLGKKSNNELASQPIVRTKLYNTVGGGPTLIRGGEVITDPCHQNHNENVKTSDCRDTNQTAVGLSQDGKTFIIVVAEPVTGEEMGNILKGYGAYSAIKLDGGASSQLWYGGELKKNGGRAIADAILIFREAIPRHDAFIKSQSEYPIVKPGEAVTLTIELRNVGFLTWENDLPYALIHTGGESFGRAKWQPLPTPIAPNGDVTWTLPIVAPQEPGAYQTRWQMGYSTHDAIEPIGPEVGFIITVLPKDSTTDLTEAIRQITEQARQEAEQQVEKFLNELQERINQRIREEEERLQKEIERQIWELTPDCLKPCFVGPGAIIFTIAILGWRKKWVVK